MNEELLIKELVYNYQKSIHTQDKALFNEIWANHNDCSLISIATLFQGKENIYQLFLIGAIQAAYESIDLIAEKIEINLINETTAIIIFAYYTECVKRVTKENYGISGIETQVAIKEDGQWKLMHVHYSKA